MTSDGRHRPTLDNSTGATLLVDGVGPEHLATDILA